MSSAIFHPASTPERAAAPTRRPNHVIRSSANTVLSTTQSIPSSIGVRKYVNNGLVWRFWIAQSRNASNHDVTSTTHRSGKPGRNHTKPMTATTTATAVQANRRSHGLGCSAARGGATAGSSVESLDRGGATAI